MSVPQSHAKSNSTGKIGEIRLRGEWIYGTLTGLRHNAEVQYWVTECANCATMARLTLRGGARDADLRL